MKSVNISGVFQFVIGFFLGICILSGTALGMAYYLFMKMTVLPDKPIFPEEKAKTISLEKKIESEQKTRSVFNETKTESEGYRARVTWPQGLILRSQPTTESVRLGAIGYNAEIIVLEESQDSEWQKIRQLQSDREGWIKAGNIEKVDP